MQAKQHNYLIGYSCVFVLIEYDLLESPWASWWFLTGKGFFLCVCVFNFYSTVYVELGLVGFVYLGNKGLWGHLSLMASQVF